MTVVINNLLLFFIHDLELENAYFLSLTVIIMVIGIIK